MGNTLEEEIIRMRIPIQNNYLILILNFLLISFLLVIFLYDYSKCYTNTAVIRKIDNIYYMEVKTLFKDIKYIEEHSIININGTDYNYQLSDIDTSLYIDKDNYNYKYLYLKLNLDKEMKVENYLLTFRIELEKKKIFKYFLEYLRKE